jgi:hypothetical protein
MISIINEKVFEKNITRNRIISNRQINENRVEYRDEYFGR